MNAEFFEENIWIKIFVKKFPAAIKCDEEMEKMQSKNQHNCELPKKYRMICFVVDEWIREILTKFQKQ